MKRERLRGEQCVKKQGKNKTTTEGEQPKCEAEEGCSAAAGVVWFLWPGCTALTLHIVSQKNPDYYHVSTLKP